MNKFLKQIGKIDKLEQYILIGLLLISFALAFLFWRSDLSIYDTSGHVSLVWYIKEYLWPKPAGWNPFFLVGFPQGLFYPSLFHWLAATLSFVVGIEIAIKLIVSLAILALPFAVYYAVKNTILDTKYQMPVTILIFVFLAALPNFLGIGLRGLFQIGLLPNFVSTPILLLFFGLVHSQFKKNRFLLISLILSVLVLTHLVAAIVAILYLLTYCKILWFRKQLKIKTLAYLVGTAAVLTSFFWIPFLINFSFTSVSAHLPSYFSPNVGLALITIPLLWLSWKKGFDESVALCSLALFLLVLAVVDSLLIAINHSSLLFDFLYPLHIYRFQPYAYLALILAFGSLLAQIHWSLGERQIRLIAVILFLLFAGYTFARSPVVGESKLFLKEVNLGGRFIESFRRTESDPLLYYAQTNLVMGSPDENQWAYGLFTDATPNGPYLGSLIRSLRPEAYPEGEGRFAETKTVDPENTQHALDLFGIKYVLYLHEDEIGQEVGRWKVGGEDKVYSVLQAGIGSLVEVTSLNPVPTSGDFEKRVEEWWDQDGGWTNLPFKTETEIVNFDTDKFDSKTRVVVAAHNDDWTKVKLNIDAEAPQPVLVKFSYFPWWKARADGHEIQIYRAAPNLMLIFANGELGLEFKEPAWLNFLYLISSATILGVIFQLFRQQRIPGSSK